MEAEVFGRKGVHVAGRQAVNAGPPQIVREPIDFDITPHPLKMLAGIGLFGGGGWSFYGEMSESRGLVINHLIRLGPDAARVFSGGMVIVALVLVLLAINGLVQSLGDRVYITLDCQSVVGPTSYSGLKTTRIAYQAISETKIQRFSGNEFLVIFGNDRSKIKIGRGNFRNKTDWNAFKIELIARIKEGRASYHWQ